VRMPSFKAKGMRKKKRVPARMELVSGLPQRKVEIAAPSNKGAPATKRIPVERQDTTTIAGVPVPNKFLGLANAVKLKTEHDWTIVTRRGVLIARFPAEEALERWWRDFQTKQGRAAKELALTVVLKQQDRVKGKKRRRVKSQPAFEDRQSQSDPLKPWSKEYDMPEYDAEGFGRM
jgi:hypothetical protein